MQLPADSFGYTHFKKFRSAKGVEQRSDVRGQISEVDCQGVRFGGTYYLHI